MEKPCTLHDRMMLIQKSTETHLKIYRAFKDGDIWGDFEDLSINGNNFSNAHPALSPDEKKLFFVSNMPGSLGETDIYVVDIHTNGTLGKATNLGTTINTQGRESFPFVSEDSELYFSSDGHFGLGGYDVFYVDLASNTNLLLNVGTPINSSQDDFAFSVFNTTKKGFFSSNRTGTDNIYKLDELKSIKENLHIEIEGIVRDKDSKSPIPNSTVTLTNERGKIITNILTDVDGNFQAKINQFMSYHIKAEKEAYENDSIRIPIQKKHRLVQLYLKKKEVKKIIPIVINETIYYDFDKISLRSDELTKLNAITTLLKNNPKVRINISSHTDSRGRAAYNQKLSEKRTQQVVQFFVQKGIDTSRMIGKGFGESRPVNNCIDGKKCSKDQHQLNRRTKITILND